MKTYTAANIPAHNNPSVMEIGSLSVVITRYDEDDGDTPWQRDDGHGPVTDWCVEAPTAGHRKLCSDQRLSRYYDWDEALKIALRDGWDTEPYKQGTKKQRAARAVQADFDLLQAWCKDLWNYIGVVVTLRDESGEVLGDDSLWGIESNGTYWREVAAEMLNTLLSDYESEQSEAAHWAARDTITVQK